MYINTEICAAILFLVTLFFGIKRWRKEKYYNEISIIGTYKSVFNYFILAFIFLMIFILQFFNVINYD